MRAAFRTVALLVSLENMQMALRGQPGDSYFATHVANQADGFVRLIVLYQWSFASWNDSSALPRSRIFRETASAYVLASPADATATTMSGRSAAIRAACAWDTQAVGHIPDSDLPSVFASVLDDLALRFVEFPAFDPDPGECSSNTSQHSGIWDVCSSR